MQQQFYVHAINAHGRLHMNEILKLPRHHFIDFSSIDSPQHHHLNSPRLLNPPFMVYCLCFDIQNTIKCHRHHPTLASPISVSKMSYYGVHHAEIDYMICNTCHAEAFTWMAETFDCPACGGSEHVFPIFADTQHPADDEDGSRNTTSEQKTWRTNSMKRKRTLSDDGEQN